MKHILEFHGLFYVGDTAYPLSKSLLIPYSDTVSGSSEDAFNFWLSNSRIQIECSFGELVMRFGMFWRTLKFGPIRSCTIISAAAKLHNFLVDCREGDSYDADFFKNMSYLDVSDSMSSMWWKDNNENETCFPLVSDNNALKQKGCKSNEEKERQLKGQEFRDLISTKLYSYGMGRPLANKMKLNTLGHVYFD